jgi:hypothetical protein
MKLTSESQTSIVTCQVTNLQGLELMYRPGRCWSNGESRVSD